MKKILKISLCLVLSLAMLIGTFGCVTNKPKAPADQDIVDFMLDYINVQATVTSATFTAPSLKAADLKTALYDWLTAEDSENLKWVNKNYDLSDESGDAEFKSYIDELITSTIVSYTSLNPDIIKDDGSVICGSNQSIVSIKITLTLNDASANKNVDVTATLNHQGLTGWKNDGDGHWHECSRAGCDHKTEAELHTPVVQADAIGHFAKCSACGYETIKEAHTFGEITVVQAVGTWQDGISSRICADCGYVDSIVEAATGFVFGSSTISDISRAEEFTYTEDPLVPGKVTLTYHGQFRESSSSAKDIKVYFAASRDSSLIEKDTLVEFTLASNQRTFTIEVDITDIFIPLSQDAYRLVINDGEEIVVKKAATTTIATTYTFNDTIGYRYYGGGAAGAELTIYKDANIYIASWIRASFTLQLEDGKPILTFGGTAYFNGANSSDTTLERTFTAWMINESAGTIGQKLCYTTAFTHTTADTRTFTFKMDLSDLPANSDWNKITIGVNEGNGEVGITNTAGSTTGSTTISSNGTDRMFTAASNTTTISSITYNGKTYRCVTAYSQVHIKCT